MRLLITTQARGEVKNDVNLDSFILDNNWWENTFWYKVINIKWHYSKKGTIFYHLHSRFKMVFQLNSA